MPLSVARTFEILTSIVKILPFTSMFSLMLVNMYLIRHNYRFLLRFIPSLFLFFLVWGLIVPFSAVWYEDLQSAIGQKTSSVVKLSAGYFRQNGNTMSYIIPDSEGYRTGTVWTHSISDSASDDNADSYTAESFDMKKTYLDNLIRDSLNEPVGLFGLAFRVSNLRTVVYSVLNESIWKYVMFATMGLAIFSLISFTGYSAWRFSALTITLFFFMFIVAANVIFYDASIMQLFPFLEQFGMWLPFTFNLTMTVFLFVAGFIRQRFQKAGVSK